MSLTIQPPKDYIQPIFIAGDWHTDALHLPSYNIMLQHAKMYPKELRSLIINGDFLDAPHLMKSKNENYQFWIKRPEGMDEYFIPESEKEFEWGNRILDECQEVFQDIIFIGGNHCDRYLHFMEGDAKRWIEYTHNFDYRKQLNLKERDIPWIAYNEWLDFTDPQGRVTLSVTHGMFHGSTCHKKHYEAAQGNCIFSHVHYDDCKTFMSRGKSRKSWSLPAFCDLNPHYIKNREINWTNGYGLIQYKPNGHFNFNTFNVWDNELILPCGTHLKG